VSPASATDLSFTEMREGLRLQTVRRALGNRFNKSPYCDLQFSLVMHDYPILRPYPTMTVSSASFKD